MARTSKVVGTGASVADVDQILLDLHRWIQKVQLYYRTFTASELASITEVSPSAQRDWRRRGIERTERAAAGWNRYTFPDLVFFSTLRLLINSGVAASSAAQLADYSVLPCLKLLTTRRGAVKFSPPDLRKRAPKKIPIERFVVFGASESQANGQNAPVVSSVADLSALYSSLRHDPRIASIVVDLKRVVDRICDRATMPLLTVIDDAHFTEIESGNWARQK
jgi:hypothetical protein